MKLMEKVKSAKILQGYVENRTKEIALAAVFASLTLIGRNISLPIFIPPLKGLEPSVVFYSSALLVLSYPYVWLFSLIITLTTNLSLLGFPTAVLSFHTFYFLSRLMGLRKAKYFSFFTVLINMVYTLIIMGWLMNLFPVNVVFIPFFIKAIAQGILALLVVPLIIKALEMFSIITVEE